MNIKAIPVGAFEVNCWILSNQQGQAIVIDPGAEPEKINQFLLKHKLVVAGYLITHGHMDHISALAPLCEQHPAPIRMHPQDAAWAFSAANQMPPYYPAPANPPPELLQANLTESTSNMALGMVYDVIETPGHSPGSVCLYFSDNGFIFTGDTIFAGSAGRTDFPGGSAEALKHSLLRLTTLPPKTTIYPGHGSATTLEEEMKTNPFMQ